MAINHEPAENRFKYVTIQIGWDVKQIAIQLGAGVYMNRLCIKHIKVNLHLIQLVCCFGFMLILCIVSQNWSQSILFLLQISKLYNLI